MDISNRLTSSSFIRLTHCYQNTQYTIEGSLLRIVMIERVLKAYLGRKQKPLAGKTPGPRTALLSLFKHPILSYLAYHIS